MGRRFLCLLAFSLLAVGARAQPVNCEHATLVKWANEHGFKVQTSDGTELYCHSVIIVGSRIPHSECGTEAELRSYVFTQVVDENMIPWTCGELRP
jgi:hypothetical protein